MLKHLQRAGFQEQACATNEVTLNYVVGPNNGPALVLIPAQIGDVGKLQPCAWPVVT